MRAFGGHDSFHSDNDDDDDDDNNKVIESKHDGSIISSQLPKKKQEKKKDKEPKFVPFKVFKEAIADLKNGQIAIMEMLKKRDVSMAFHSFPCSSTKISTCNFLVISENF